MPTAARHFGSTNRAFDAGVACRMSANRNDRSRQTISPVTYVSRIMAINPSGVRIVSNNNDAVG